MKSLFGFRNTFIYDANGQPCYRTWSQGAYVNKATGRLAKLGDVLKPKTIQTADAFYVVLYIGQQVSTIIEFRK